jgi:hypothetical protein
MLHCIATENSGIITACAVWTDRQWILTIGVEKREVEQVSTVWHWEGSDLHVWAYPMDSQLTVEANRRDGKKGGRGNKKTSPETPTETPRFKHKDKGKDNGNAKEGEEEREDNTPIVPKGTDSPPPFGSDLDSDRPPPPTGQSETEKKKKGSRPKLVWTEETKAIYLAYPRKIAPDAALRAIQKRLAQGIPAATLLAAVTAYATATAGTEREFIPHPATWFNAGRFADDPAEWKHEPDAPQKKEKASRILPEPDFDWRARARELGMNPPDHLQWSQTTPDFRREITAA